VIYCAPCHGQTGKGNGIVAQRGFLPPPTFHSDLIRGYPDGQIYEAIANGIRNMPSYRSQIPVADRWAVVAYVRALQRSQFATADDVPSEIRKDLK
jgi:mono/diheme cytochrome c family protein